VGREQLCVVVCYVPDLLSATNQGYNCSRVPNWGSRERRKGDSRRKPCLRQLHHPRPASSRASPTYPTSRGQSQECSVIGVARVWLADPVASPWQTGVFHRVIRCRPRIWCGRCRLVTVRDTLPGLTTSLSPSWSIRKAVKELSLIFPGC
jgi:hypothetical protein